MGRIALGTEEFVEQLLRRPAKERYRAELAQVLAARPSFAQVIEAVE